MSHSLSRRQALAGAIGASGLATLARPGALLSQAELRIGSPLPPWRPASLDIHHLGYGRGDATLLILPNGAAALIDAGAVVGNGPDLVRPAKGVGLDAGAWIARYIQRQIIATGASGLKAAIITHLHQDHIGQARRYTPFAAEASHQHTGISSVAERLEIETLYDPDWPDYGYPAFEGRASVENYIAFVRKRAASGRRVVKLTVGEVIDLGTKSRAAWNLRTVASRGRVWTGQGEDKRDVFPARGDLIRTDWPNENAMSAGFLATLGPFKYFAGGDLTDWGDAGTRNWMNALSPVAQAIGPVSVSTLPHHGMFDASSTETLKALKARDWVISAWHASHPSLSTLERVFNERIYSGPRDVYPTALHASARTAMRRLTDRCASQGGNVICRVEPDGRSYRMIVTDPDCVADTVLGFSEVRTLEAI